MNSPVTPENVGESLERLRIADYYTSLLHVSGADLSVLPKKPEHVIFTINDTRLEESFDELIRLGIKACTIFSSLILQTDSEPNLKSRINAKAKEQGILIIGANSMGVYNIANNTLIGGFDTRDHPSDGNTTLISQSGAGMSGIVDCEERIKFNLAVSTGYELTTTMEDYLEYAIDLPDTKVIGLFLETVRNPEKFIMCLERAAEEKIPIVVIKVGKTELSKKMAESHSGAMAGSDRAYNALFRRFGVLRVDDMEQMSACLIMISHTNSVGTGDLVCLHDSGGERQLLIDLADSLDVPLAKISEDTKLELNQILDPGLPAVNPLDGWGAGGANASEVMASSFEKLFDPSLPHVITRFLKLFFLLIFLIILSKSSNLFFVPNLNSLWSIQRRSAFEYFVKRLNPLLPLLV